MAEQPFVSVVIPMRNEAAHIARCLDSVLAQEYPPDRFEVVVVDGDSDDDSRGVLARYGDRIRVLQNRARIVPHGMNVGIAAARGEIIARVDAHTVLDASYLRLGVAALRRTGADNVGGAMHAVGGGLRADAIAAAMSSRFGIGAYFHFGTEEREVDTVYMGMYPRAVFERIGLFDEELVRDQDDELNYRLRAAAGRVLLVPEMRSRYQNRESFKALARQFFQYGMWKVRVLQKHPRQMSARQFVPPVFVLALLVAVVLAFVAPAGSALLLGLCAAYAVASMAAAAMVARRHGWRLFAPVVVAFAVMHVGWGSGFLFGAVRFASRWFVDEPTPPRLQEKLET
jgi:glycosyltransferase involved in cell wall biosynthesis